MSVESVELFQTWHPGGAQGNNDYEFLSGDQYLFAVRLSDERWEFVAAYAYADPETPLSFLGTNDEPLGWDWSDVEWFVPCGDLDLPVPAEIS